MISAQPTTGGTLQIVYASHVYAVTAARVVDAHTLLFIIGGKYGAEPSPYDNNLAPGLWKIQVDGTHLTQLSREGRFLSQVHATWSTVSPDGKHYAAGGYNTVGSQLAPRLFYGSLPGGPVTSFAQAQVGEDLQLVGWTTLAPAASASGAWKITGSMHNARSSFSATLLKNGLVLVAGGWNGSAYLSDAELYHPATGTWTSTSNMHIARATFSATLLNNGKVLIAGGIGNGTEPVALASAELYDPLTGTWSSTGSMHTPREGQTATLLRNGEVLVAGGDTSSAEIYNPATGTWNLTGNMTQARRDHTATLLLNGQVLVAGGDTSNSLGGIATAEVYNPRTGTWSSTTSMHLARRAPTATLLNDGKVLVAGGGDVNNVCCVAIAEV